MPYKKFFLTIIFCLYFCSFGSPRIFAEYRFDSWTTDNGLPQNGLREITQTPDGYLWFTTFDGLVRFDGVKFTTFNKGNTNGILNSRFTGIYSDKTGTIYASTTENGVLTVYQNGVFSSFRADEVPERYVKFIKPDETGELRFLVETGDHKTETWYYLRNGKFVFDKTENKGEVELSYQGKSGRNWQVSADKVIELKNGNPTVYEIHIDEFDSQIELFEDKNGGLWISGTRLIRLKDGKIEKFGQNEKFPPNTDFHSFWEESDGSFWFANGGRNNPGLGIVRYKDGEFSVFGKESGLSDTNIINVFRDREGIVWLTTNKGLNRLVRKVLKTYSVKDGLDNQEVYPIYRDSKENIWIGTARGLNVYRDGNFETIDFEHKSTPYSKVAHWKKGNMSIQSIFEDSNDIMWIGVSGGIFLAENGKVEMLEISEGHHVQAFVQDDKGLIWAATSRGILVFEDYKLKEFYNKKDGLPNNFMTVAYQDSKGRLWFGGYGGLSEFKDGKFINYTSKEGLAGNYVRTIYEDAKGTFWIGTYDEGLSRFKDGKFVNYKRENGLYSNGAFAIEEDANGYFWISSNQGIYRVHKKSLNDFADGRINRVNSIGYDKSDGMLNNECNGGRQPASIEDKDGNFWFPTQDGVVVVNPNFERHNLLPPLVTIESATVERKEVSIDNGLEINSGLKNIEINFTGISFIKSEQIKFQYKLEGHDEEWIDAGVRRTAYYSHLPPGDYKFQVKAANSDGIWNAAGAELNIKLQPFFYQKTSFYFLCGLVVVLSLILIWRLSVYQLKSRQRLLKKLVAEKTKKLKLANEELEQLANSDGLTEVANRRLFEDFLGDEWNRAVRYKTKISLILLDIDYFKLYNDTYGHHAGDECLKQFAAALAKTIHRPTDLVARFGGEEFAIILGGTDLEGAVNIAEQAMQNINGLKIPHRTSETSEYLTVSVGVATMFVNLGMSESELIEKADKALYNAKESGRNQICTSEDLAPFLPTSDIILHDNSKVN